MASKKKSSYVPVPTAEPKVLVRLRLVLLVQTGQMTVSEAARQLSLSRNHFQSLKNKAMAAMVQALTPQLPGRPSGDPQLRELMQELSELEQDNETLQRQLSAQEQIIRSLTELVRQQSVKTTAKTSKSRSTSRRGRRSRTGKTKSLEDPDSEARFLLGRATEMRAAGCSHRYCARGVDRHESTLRRWRARQAQGLMLVQRRGPGPKAPVDADTRWQVADHVRALKGQVGAVSLAKSFESVSRRQAAAIKAETLTKLERERIEGCGRVTVLRPGVVRGMDEMYVRTLDGPRKLFICADAAVAMRTTVELQRRIDTEATMGVLREDIATHGPPLAYRLDRAKAHDAAAVRELLEHHGILLLHGPPHCARYYGQLERQNREHRAWLPREPLPAEDLARQLPIMQHALNALWRRPSLHWRTAAELHAARPPVDVDRDALRHDVATRTQQLRERIDMRGRTHDFPERLAIELALGQLGLLQVTTTRRSGAR